MDENVLSTAQDHINMEPRVTEEEIVEKKSVQSTPCANIYYFKPFSYNVLFVSFMLESHPK